MFWKIRNYFDRYERRMRKLRKRFYNKPKAEETYALDYAICEMLIPRLELYVEKASQMVVKDEHFAKISKTIEALKLYKDLYDNPALDYRDERQAWDDAIPIVDEGLRFLAEEFYRLGW